MKLPEDIPDFMYMEVEYKDFSQKTLDEIMIRTMLYGTVLVKVRYLPDGGNFWGKSVVEDIE